MAVTVDVPGLFPDNGVVGDVLVITGTGFLTVTGITFPALFGTAYEVSASFTIIDDNTIHVTVPSPGGSAHYLVDGYLSLYDGISFPAAVTETFTPDDPGSPVSVTSISISSGAHGDRMDIVGAGFSGIVTGVAFNGVFAAYYVVDDSNIITWVPPGVPSAVTGDVTVINTHGPSAAGFAFTCYLRSIGSASDHVIDHEPTLGIGPLSDHLLLGIPFLSLGPMSDETFAIPPTLALGPTLDQLLSANDGGSDSLALTEDVDSPVAFNDSRADSFDLSDAIADHSEVEENVSDSLDLTDGTHLVWADVVASAFDLSDVADSSDLRDAFSVTDDIDDSLATGVESDLNLTDDTTVHASYHDSVSDDLDFVEGFIAFVARPSSGTGLADQCDPAYLTIAPITLLDDVVFSWDILSVTLRAPEFGNALQLDTGAEVRKTRGGQFSIIRPDEWPNVRVLKMTFTGISNAKMTEFVEFLDQSSGRQITFRDHEDTTWHGVVLDQEADVVRDKPDCNNEISIEFRGVRT